MTRTQKSSGEALNRSKSNVPSRRRHTRARQRPGTCEESSRPIFPATLCFGATPPSLELSASAGSATLLGRFERSNSLLSPPAEFFLCLSAPKGAIDVARSARLKAPPIRSLLQSNSSWTHARAGVSLVSASRSRSVHRFAGEVRPRHINILAREQVDTEGLAP